jgi:ribosomal protein S18 acetylase RimI-like enzyme
MTDSTIRDAMPGEAAALADLQRRAASVWESDRTLLQAHPDLIQPPVAAIAEGRVRVAVGSDGEILGFCVVARGVRALEIDDLFVEPAVMGRGIGRALVEDAVAAAGAQAVEATANDNAVGFYERLGFVIVGQAQTLLGPAPRMRLESPRGK